MRDNVPGYKYKALKNCFMVFAGCIIFLFPSKLFSQPRHDTLLINQPGEYEIAKHLYIYETNKEFNPHYIWDSVAPNQFVKLFPVKSYNDIQHPSNYYWLLFTIKNNMPADETFYFQLNHPQLYSVIAYQKVDTGFMYTGKSGYAYPFSQKMYHYYDNVFPVQLKCGQTLAIMLSITIGEGYNPFFAPQLSDANTFKAKEQKFYLVNGLIAGIMLTAFLLNIFLGLSLKERLHYLYAVYILCILYEIFLSQGLDSQYFYPDSTRKLSLIRYIIPCSCIVLLAYIMQWFLNQKRSNSRLKIFVDIVNFICIGVTALYCLLHVLNLKFDKTITSVFQTSLACFAVVQLLLVFASAVEKAIQGYKPAWFYIAAILFLFRGLLEYVFMYLGVNDVEASELKHPNDMQVGLVVETLIVFLGIVYRYNLYKKEKEILLTEVNTHQQNLINRIVAAQEEERKRIAEDLHDDVGATLSALAMHISNTPDTIKSDVDIEKYYSHSLFLSNKAVGDIRTIAHNLLPKDFKSLGLFKILEKRIEELNRISKTGFTLITEGDEKKLSEVIAITVYRVINELMTNILKHSLASEAAIQVLIEESNIQIMTEDDGIGFNREIEASNGIGLKNIKGRIDFLKGNLTMDTSQGGTTTIIHIPL